MKRPLEISSAECNTAQRSYCERISSGRVLVVGDGDLSFSAALAAAGNFTQLVASTLESYQVLTSYYASAAKHVSAVEATGAEVRHEIDATKLHEAQPPLDGQGAFTRIIFNFPHIDGKNKIKPNRELVQKFMESAGRLLAKEGEVHVTLCKGQGGTPAERSVRKWVDHWQIVPCAASAGMLLVEVIPFVSAEFPGYGPRREAGNRGRDRRFDVEGALTHVFVKHMPSDLPAPEQADIAVTKTLLGVRNQLLAHAARHLGHSVPDVEHADYFDAERSMLEHAGSSALWACEAVVQNPESSSIGPDTNPTSHQLLLILTAPGITERELAREGAHKTQSHGFCGLSIAQFLADALGVDPSRVEESNSKSGLERTSCMSEFPGPAKFRGAFQEECASHFACVQAQVRMQRISLTVASEDNPETSGWRPEDFLDAAAAYTSQQIPTKTAVFFDLQVCTMAALGIGDRRLLGLCCQQACSSLSGRIHRLSLWPVTYHFKLLFVSGVSRQAITKVLRQVGGKWIFLAFEEAYYVQNSSDEAVRCFHLYVNSVDTPLTYMLAYKIFQDIRRRVNEDLHLKLR